VYGRRIVILIRILPRRHRFDADPDPDPSPSFTKVGKFEVLNLFTAEAHCFIFLISVEGVIIFNILRSILKNYSFALLG
jgi:hypothetical protein